MAEKYRSGMSLKRDINQVRKIKQVRYLIFEIGLLFRRKIFKLT